MMAFPSFVFSQINDEEKYATAIYKESDVPNYVLPDVLQTFKGKKVTSVRMWEKERKPEILRFLSENFYGIVPKPIDPIKVSFEIVSEDSSQLEGLCTRRDVMITLKNKLGEVKMPLVLFFPNKQTKPSPTILWFNIDDLSKKRFDLDGPQGYGKTKNGAPLKQLMLRGIALASIDGGALVDRDKSRDDILDGRLVSMFFKEGQTNTLDNEWGIISIWAYGLSRAVDYLVTDKNINPNQIAVMGNSISGKVSIWAATQDKRIGMVLSSTSGHGGAAIFRRQVGETIANMTEWLPRWICRNAKKYANDLSQFPVDMHMLLASIAPRPLYVATAIYDYWADQKGEWLGAYNAAPVYRLYGKTVSFKDDNQPSVNSPIIKSQIGYHSRTGFHGLHLYDWERFMEFIEYHFMKIPIRSAHEVYYPNESLFNHYPNKNRESCVIK